jgi:hypothetical protein
MTNFLDIFITYTCFLVGSADRLWDIPRNIKAETQELCRCWSEAQNYGRSYSKGRELEFNRRQTYTHCHDLGVCDYRRGLDWWLDLMTIYTLTTRDYTSQIIDTN